MLFKLRSYNNCAKERMPPTQNCVGGTGGESRLSNEMEVNAKLTLQTSTASFVPVLVVLSQGGGSLPSHIIEL
jgi:hypothetical protein